MANDFTVADVLAWARTKPANESYDFFRSDVCALGQYAQEMRGFSRADARGEAYSPLVSLKLLHAVQGADDPRSCEVRWTFGELVKRLEALAPDAPFTWQGIDAYLTDIEQVSA